MFNNQSNYSDTYEREKLRILQTLNVQIQSMAVKLDQIVSQVEENVFKIKTSPKTSLITINTIDTNNSIKPATINSITLAPAIINTNTNKIIELSSNHQLVKIIDQPLPESEITVPSNKTSSTINNINNLNSDIKRAKKSANRKAKSIKNLTKNSNLDETALTTSTTNISSLTGATTSNGCTNVTINNDGISSTNGKSGVKSDTTAKRNKQQRQFNTFVRESINQLLGPDFMKTHDVQDIDQHIMEMIRKEAVENYLPDNIRPRRAWHLAKASLRTLKRTLNNRKT